MSCKHAFCIFQSNPFRGSQTKDIPPDMESRPASSSSSGGSLNYPKTLRTSCLHRALEINKVSKKMAFKNFKVVVLELLAPRVVMCCFVLFYHNGWMDE